MASERGDKPSVVYAWIPDLQEAEQNGDAMVEIKTTPGEGYAPLYLQSAVAATDEARRIATLLHDEIGTGGNGSETPYSIALRAVAAYKRLEDDGRRQPEAVKVWDAFMEQVKAADGLSQYPVNFLGAATRYRALFERAYAATLKEKP